MADSGDSLRRRKPPSPIPNYPLTSSKTLNSHHLPLLISFNFLLLITSASPSPSSSPSNILQYYSQKCNTIVPESPSTVQHPQISISKDKYLYFDIAYFTGGHPILPKRASSPDSPSGSLSFHPKRNTLFATQTPNVVKLQGTLKFHLPPLINMSWKRNIGEINFRPPRIPVRPRFLVFELFGFWDVDTGKLCMVGSPSSRGYSGSASVSSSNVVLKLDYPVNFRNASSLISGVLESFEDEGGLGYFEAVSILGIPGFGEYKYTLLNNGSGDICVAGSGDNSVGKNDNLGLEFRKPSACLTKLYQYARTFELEYGRDCGSSGECNPLGVKGLPRFMTIEGIRCEPGSGIRFLIGFSDSGFYDGGPFSYGKVFDPNRMLIGEGMWDEKKNRLCVVACRVMHLNGSLLNASVGECSIRLSLWFPRTLTIMNRSTVVGQISNILPANETGYFDRIEFHGSKMVKTIPGLAYEYTMLNRVAEFCPIQKTKRGRGKAYPNAYSTDMKFQMSVRNGRTQIAQGFASPFFVSDQLYEPYWMHKNQSWMHKNQSGVLNISYKISFSVTSDLTLGGKFFSNESSEMSAEGTYDNGTGVLCMIGCLRQSGKTDPVDCEVLVNVQFAPLNAKAGANIKGTIKSMRNNSDPMYFRQLEISSDSIYTRQAADSIWRMDMEIAMVLISNTLACVFVGLQLYHVKKYPDVLPFISFMMLTVLTLSYMIPLLLNFEALFVGSRNRQDLFLQSGKWFEVNEVIVRVVTMVAFLLQFRLLQLSWTARCSDGSHSSLWLSEKRVLFLSLPLYIGGGLIAWYVQEWKNSYKSPYLHSRFSRYQQKYQWESLKSYAGLILDGFLLPQIIFNIFSNSKETALASSFYVGKTVVRLLPHAYDLYRVHSATWSFDMAFIYGNHKQDFYSTAWDIVIPCVGLFFAAFVYLQQRFGGRFVLPKRFKETCEYEKVSAVIREEVQGVSVQ
ncbi:hypothetical protein M5689_008810 [Euphorbia peplus]|nr:hypothetical protein M5689_008810 [Euphorbia peplus]